MDMISPRLKWINISFLFQWIVADGIKEGTAVPSSKGELHLAT
jgi:hypothetical protein